MRDLAKRSVAYLLSFIMVISSLPMNAIAMAVDDDSDVPTIENVDPDQTSEPSEPEVTPEENEPSLEDPNDVDPETSVGMPSGVSLQSDDGTPSPAPAGDIGNKILAKAEELFGNNGGSAPQIEVGVVSPDESELLAGNTVKYTIQFAYSSVPYWSEGYDMGRTFFDQYENNTITFTLPEGLLLSKVPEAYEKGMKTIENPDHSHTYIFNVGNWEPSGAQFNFEAQVYIQGNGTENAIRFFDMKDAVTFSTQFTVLDKSAAPYKELKTYKQTVVASPEDVHTISPDVWGVQKDVTSAKVDRSSMTATVEYLVRVGLMDGDSMITSVASYNRFGRDALTSISLTDADLTAVLKDLPGFEGKSPELISASIKKAGASDSTAVSVPSSDAIALSGNFALNTSTVADRVCIIDASSVGHVSASSNTVPVYTEYVVKASYKITDAMIMDFDKANGKIDFANTAKLNYQLANKAAAEDEDSADAEVPLPVRGAASLLIKKYLKNYQGTVKAYNNEYGSITYTISSADSKKFTVYNDKMQVIASDVTSWNAAQANTNYYLTPGISYTVSEQYTNTNMVQDETGCKDLTKTPAEGENWTATFQNKELAADIKVIKKDTAGNVIQGAEFTLSGNGINKTLTTNGSGELTFTKIPYGTYTLKETKVPQGFSGSFEETVKVEKNETLTYTATNKRNVAAISLTKYVGVAQDTITTKANANFKGTFVLERSLDGKNWETVTKDAYGQTISTAVNSTGMIVANVAPFDENGNVYSYRFKETIPDGYYDPANPTAAEAYSASVTLVDAQGNALANTKNVGMENRQKVSVTVNKEFWEVSSTGKLTKNTTKSVDVTLYKYVNNQFVKVGDTKSAGTAAAVWNNLLPYENGAAVKYYVAEASVDGYKLDKTKTGNTGIITQNGVDYIPVALASTSATSASKTLYNVEQVIPVLVKKQNYYTEAFVNGTGFSITLNGSAAKDAKDNTAITDKMITTASGVVVYLKPGEEYKLTETVNTSGMIDMTGEIAIDLKNAVPSTYADKDKTTNLKTYIIKNAPDPAIKITKKDNNNNVISGAVYSVYTKQADGKFAPYKDANGNIVTISANNAVSSVRLPAGDYYLAETTVPAGFIDPNKVPDEYIGKFNGQEYQVGTTTDGKTYTFVKAVVTDAAKNGKNDNTCSFTFNNVSNKANLVVTKYIDGAVATVAGFPVVIKNGETEVKTGTTNDKGVYTAANLDIYDANGNKIQYTVDEGALSADQAKIYYQVSDAQTVELTVGQTAQATIANKTLTSVEVSKYYAYSWESQFTTLMYPMDGAGMALYVLDGDTYKLVETKNTVAGSVSFSGLRRENAYAVVEYSSPDPYMVPFDNGAYKALAADEQGNALASIPAADISKYNVRTLAAETDGKTRDKVVTLGDMMNKDHWVQFDITKWLDNDFIMPHGTAVNKNEDTKYDNAVFNLYRLEVPAGQTSVEFNTGDPSAWELMGTYSSGTAYDINGNRLEGEFLSNVDEKAATNVVYMLVESNPGPNGGIINPNFKYTFWKNTGKEYNVTLTGKDSSYTVRKKDYILDQVNKDDILNSKEKTEGDGAILISAIRIAKWSDTFDQNGNPEQKYQPLPNASFGIYLDAQGATELETMTVGLDAEDDYVKAWAQGAAYGLQIQNEDSQKGLLTVYAKQDENGDPLIIPVDVEVVGSNDDYTVLGVKVYLRENSAPVGFTYEPGMIPMYLCFVYYNGTTGIDENTVFNDAYFVTAADTKEPLVSAQMGTSAYVTWDKQGQSHAFGSTMYRIVDYPMENTMVRIQKYGYTPTQAMIGMTSAQLDGMTISDRVGLAGIEMQIQRYDDAAKTWKNWDYGKNTYTEDASKAKFETNASGSYMFAKGLLEGQYRVIETKLNTYASTYENAYDKWDHARVFTVGKASQVITMYNPKKTELAIVKKDTDGEVVKGVEFTLTVNGSNIKVTTGDDGKAVFTGLASGTYKLTEAKVNDVKLSAQYLAAYATGDLKKLVDGNAAVGYALVSKDVEGGKDRVVSSIGLTAASGTLEVVDPKLVSFSVKKVNEEDKTEVLQGAEFKVYFKAFDKWSGEMTVSAPDSKWSGWSDKGTITTNAQGIASMTDKTPGIYAFYETKAPAGYDIITNNGSAKIYYLVLTGGMNVTVKGITADVTSADTTTTVPQITVENRPQVKMTAEKHVTQGMVKDTLNWTVTIALYESKNGSRIGQAQVKSTDTDAVTFKAGNADVLLSQGKTYYIKEDAIEGYNLTGLKINGTLAEAEDGYFAVTVSGSDTIEIDVTNAYMYGFVSFMKVDSKDFNQLLSGAGFAVCTMDEKQNLVPVAGSSVKEILDENNQGTGKYQAKILLKSVEETTYYIVETSAPDGYILNNGIKLEVKLSAEENVIDWTDAEEGEQEKYLTNVKGCNLTIQKYANLFSAEELTKAGSGDASFRLFHYNKTKEAWEIETASLAVNAEGQAQFLLTPYEDYAFCEISFKTGKFISLDTWTQDVKVKEEVDGEVVEKISRTAADIQQIEVGDKKYDVIVLHSVQDSYAYSAFNIPALQVKIVKKDVGGYPANIIPTASFSIYELEEALPAVKADAEEIIADLLASEDIKPVFSAVTDQVEGNTTYKMWNQCDPTKNYVIVETLVGSRSQDAYDTLNKDDSRVVWYKAIDANESPDLDVVPVYELDNVYSEATVTLVKGVVESSDSEEGVENDVVNGKVESLLEGDRHVVYTVKPVVSDHNQPLTTFVVEDQGLTFAPVDAEYEITSIIVGKASQNTDNFITAIEKSTISAQVVWTDKDGNSHDYLIKDISEEAVEVTTSGAVSFSVEYYSAEVETATSQKYVLGSEFTVDPITVNAVVYQQEDGTVQNPVVPVKEFVNKASVLMTYPKWKADGSGTEDVSLEEKAEAKVQVKDLPYPVVKIEKSSDPSDAVELGKEITYTFKITNNSDVPFVDPVVVDLLPTGVTFTGAYSVGVGEKLEVFEASVSRISGKPTLKYSTAEGSIAEGDAETAVLINMKGTLEPHSSVELSIVAKIGDSTIIYGDVVYNPVFLSSNKYTYHTQDNPHGYSFRLSDGKFPGTLSEEAAKLSNTAGKREPGVHDELGKYADNETRDYVWVRADSQVKLLMKGSVTLVKAIQGDQDTGFSAADGFLATSTRTNHTPGDETDGWVNYRLTVINGQNTDKNYLVVGDALPRVGDRAERASMWNVIMDNINTVVFEGKVLQKDKDYFLYYYTGDVSTADAQVQDALKVANQWSTNKAWPQLTTLPENWHRVVEETEEVKNDFDIEDVTAFVIVFNHDQVLHSGKTFIITYHTLVENIEDDAAFTEIAFENSANEFYTNFKGSMNNKPMKSNIVFDTIMDGRVAVGGDLWIDEDMDGIQQTDGNRRDYSQYAIIQKLIEAMEFDIVDERKTASKNHDDQGGENDTPTVSESIKHFYFNELGAALQVRDPLYKNQLLNTSALKTTDPYNYSLVAEIKDKSLLEIFALTTLGSGHYMSDDPADFPDPEAPEATTNVNYLDSNFYEVSEGKYVTDPFYLRYSLYDDISKDIGFTMIRGLEISKVDEAGQPIAGVKFSISGPFDEGEASENGNALKFTLKDGVYVLDAKGTETVLTTDEKGKIQVEGLNWWKEYVITEVETVDNYSLAKATAAASAEGTRLVALEDADGEAVEAKWVLQIPGTTKVAKNDKIVVTNVEPDETELVIPVEKEVTGNETPEDKVFTFTLEAVSEDAPMPEVLNEDGKAVVTVIGSGSAEFGTITYTEEGTWIYKVSEVEEDETGYTYDDAVYTVVVTVVEDHGQLVASKAITKTDKNVTDAKAETIKFVNVYTPVPVTAVYDVTKIFDEDSHVRPADNQKTFEFELTAVTQNAPMPEKAADALVKIVDHGTGSFGQITFTAADEYEYKVVEKANDGAGFTCDTTVYSVVVTVTDNDGTLEKVVKYTVNDEVKDGITFVNHYEPAPVEVVLPVEKLMSGNSIPVDKTFEFVLAGKDGAVMPEGEGNNTQITVPAGKTTGSSEFGKITYTEPGTYVYEVTEIEGEDEHVSYDGTTHTYTVVVTDIQGALKAKVYLDKETEDGGVAEFENTYTPEPDTQQFEVKKEFTGNDRPIEKTFTFVLAPVVTDGTTPMPEDVNEEGMAVVTITDEGTAAFDEIEYTAAGEWSYTVSEVKEDETGYTYDETVYTVVVTVVDNDGELEASKVMTKPGEEAGTVDEVDEMVFVNDYTPGTVNAVINVEKIFDDASHDRPADNQKTFEFVLSAVTEKAPMPEKAEGALVKIVDSGSGSFGQISFTEAGEYVYNVVEVANDGAGFTCDTTVYSVVVTVTDNDGTLEKEVEYLANDVVWDGITFVNHYEPATVDVELPVEKLMSGNPIPVDKTFEFVLAGKDGAVMPEGEGNKTQITVPAGETTESSKFGTITYTKAGTYVYEVTETEGEDEHVSYAAAAHTYTVVVTDSQGVLSAKVYLDNENAAGGVAEFENIYTPEPDTQQFEVKKEFTGNVRPIEKTFTFVLAPVVTDGTTPMPEDVNEEGMAVVTITDEGTAIFGEIEYTEAREWSYTVSEVKEDETGYTYDETVYTVVVTVVDNDGVLEASKVMTKPVAEDAAEENSAEESRVEEVEEMVFTNDYTPVPDTQQFEVKKEFTGNVRPIEKTFTFVLAPVVTDGTTPMPEDVNEEGMAVVTITDEGTAIFGEIEYTEAREWSYTVSEVKEDETGYTYDETVYTVVVTVVDNDGVLAASKVMTKPVAEDPAEENSAEESRDEEVEEMVFTNDYTPVPVDVVLPVDKTMEGNPIPEDKTFDFVLEAEEGTPMPAEDGDQAQIVVLWAETNGSAEFGTITYTEAGTYTYTVSEVTGEDHGVGYDTAVHTYTVEVTDNDGILELEVYLDEEEVPGGTAEFVNTYKPDEVQLIVPVLKDIMGNATPIDKEFTFTLTAVTENAPMPEEGMEVVTIIGCGESEFGTITYDFAGVYEYTVSEVKGSETGYIYDETVYTVRVRVDDNEGVLKLTTMIFSHVEEEVGPEMDAEETNEEEVDPAEMEAGPVRSRKVVFINDYKPNTDSIVIPVKKTIEGDTHGNKEKTFYFELSAITKDAPMPEENVVPEGNVIAVVGEGTASFSEITYEQAGTYEYQLVESDMGANGYFYDKSVHHIVVTVVDNDGNLKAEWTLDGEEGQTVEFINEYKPAPIEVPLEGFKVIQNLTLKEGMYRFELKDEEGNLLEVATNADNGKIYFSPITYDEVGTYTYYVNEIPEGMFGTEYDKHISTVHVYITDVDGILKYEIDAPDDIKFANVYLPDQPGDENEVKVVLTATKILENRELEDGMFSFILTDEEGNVLQTVKNLADGGIAFEAMKYTEEGVYTYYISEVQGDIPGVVYDTATFMVRVHITKDGKNFQAKIEAPEAPEFVNEYYEIEVGLEASKVLKNLKLKNGMFSFELKDEEGNVIEVVTNDNDGRIAFTPIMYYGEGTYTYTISEIQGDMQGVTYDKTSYTVQVIITMGEDGLEAEIVAPAEPVFVNTYTPEVPGTGNGPANNEILLGLAAAAAAILVVTGKKKSSKKN